MHSNEDPVQPNTSKKKKKRKKERKEMLLKNEFVENSMEVSQKN